MKVSIISSIVATLLAASSAAPVDTPRQSVTQVSVNFIGAANTGFTQTFPADGQRYGISNSLSITYISISQVGVYCTFYGIDGSVTPVAGGQTLVPVGPPQDAEWKKWG